MLRIHVVNSIKGGCGKSTICLHLADYLNRQGLSPLIIDIDLCGTSWYKNYEEYLGKNFNKENYHFVNDLIDNFGESVNGHYIANIKTNVENDNTAKFGKDIKICMADPERNTHIEEVELDLFENAICNLIINRCAEIGKMNIEDGVSKDIDIILDMPPGYEAHAERIVNHLLLDVNSPLYRKIKKDKIDYRILLYMVTGLSASGIELNIDYIEKLFLNQSISEDISTRLKKDNILFILNDATNKLEVLKNNGGTIIENINKYKKFDKLNNVVKNRGDKKEENPKISIKLLNHINIKTSKLGEFYTPDKNNGNKNVVNETAVANETKIVNVSDDERSEFSRLFEGFSLSTNEKEQ